MALSEKLLAILACPVCKGSVRYLEEKPALVCDRCSLSFPVRDGIPVMLTDEAQRLGE